LLKIGQHGIFFKTIKLKKRKEEEEEEEEEKLEPRNFTPFFHYVTFCHWSLVLEKLRVLCP